MTNKTPHLLCIGLGYSARYLALAAQLKGWHVSGTTRTPEKAATISQDDITPVLWSDPLILPVSLLESVTDIIVSAAPRAGACPVLTGLTPFLQNFTQLRSIVYYSSTGVYGDAQGNWIDETSPTTTQLERGKARLLAEVAWQEAAQTHSLSLHILRLSGIYGPHRNALETLLRQTAQGTARRVFREGQFFNRIHVADIAQITLKLLSRLHDGAPPPRQIYNLADEAPCPPEEVVAHAAQLLGLPLPPLVPFEEAELTPMGRSFYAESKRIRNQAIKVDIGYTLQFPDYKAGLQALLPSLKQGD